MLYSQVMMTLLHYSPVDQRVILIRRPEGKDTQIWNISCPPDRAPVSDDADESSDDADDNGQQAPHVHRKSSKKLPSKAAAGGRKAFITEKWSGTSAEELIQ